MRLHITPRASSLHHLPIIHTLCPLPVLHVLHANRCFDSAICCSTSCISLSTTSARPSKCNRKNTCWSVVTAATMVVVVLAMSVCVCVWWRWCACVCVCMVEMVLCVCVCVFPLRFLQSAAEAVMDACKRQWSRHHPACTLRTHTLPMHSHMPFAWPTHPTPQPRQFFLFIRVALHADAGEPGQNPRPVYPAQHAERARGSRV